MRSIILSAVVFLAAATHAKAAEPTAVAKGTTVLPRLGVEFKDGNETLDLSRLAIPWIVQGVKDDLLRIGQRHKYWVPRIQVVTLEEAPDYYTQLIDKAQDAANAYLFRAIARTSIGAGSWRLPILPRPFGCGLAQQPTAPGRMPGSISRNTTKRLKISTKPFGSIRTRDRPTSFAGGPGSGKKTATKHLPTSTTPFVSIRTMPKRTPAVDAIGSPSRSTTKRSLI